MPPFQGLIACEGFRTIHDAVALTSPLLVTEYLAMKDPSSAFYSTHLEVWISAIDPAAAADAAPKRRISAKIAL